MNKKSVFVIIIAGILILFGAYLLLKPTISKTTELQEIEPIQEETVSTPEPENSQPKEPVLDKTVKKQPTIKVQKAPMQTEVTNPIQSAAVTKEEELDNPKEIVITREYKMKSPAKYIFK